MYLILTALELNKFQKKFKKLIGNNNIKAKIYRIQAHDSIMCGYFHCTKNHIFFFQMFWKDSLSKKIALIYDHWDMIFLVSPGKMIFLFPENMILLFRRKMKDDLSQKIHRNMIYSSNVLKRWSFHKNRSGIWSFFYHQERWYFFFPKIWYFSTDGKWKMIFRKKYIRIWCFQHLR